MIYSVLKFYAHANIQAKKTFLERFFITTVILDRWAWHKFIKPHSVKVGWRRPQRKVYFSNMDLLVSPWGGLLPQKLGGGVRPA